jgi:hypothetical protein
MPNKRLPMKLSREEEVFLRHWMYDEVHFLAGTGPAKRLQVEHRALPAHLALLIAAAWPDTADQISAGHGPPPTEAPTWPWCAPTLADRVAQASAILGAPPPTLGQPTAARLDSADRG